MIFSEDWWLLTAAGLFFPFALEAAVIIYLPFTAALALVVEWIESLASSRIGCRDAI